MEVITAASQMSRSSHARSSFSCCHRRKWTAMTYMYIIVRYVPWIVLIGLLPLSLSGSTGLEFTPGQCKAWQFVQGVLLQVSNMSVDVILVTRVYALYRKSRVLLQILVGLLLAEFSFFCYVLAVVTPRLSYDAKCYVMSNSAASLYYWIVPLLFGTILFALTMYKFIGAMLTGWGTNSVMQRFVADGTWAYTLIFLVVLVDMLVYKFAHSVLSGICYTWLIVVLSFSGSRLILNPRRAFVSSQESTANDESSHIEFTRLSTGRPPRAGSPIRIPAHVRTSGAHGLGLRNGVLVTIERISDRPSVGTVACLEREHNWGKGPGWNLPDGLRSNSADDRRM
ncbi:hypothetical protein C8Q79DRAFT_424683 [Trametes meyenii]|nr:hypothetical protein C8Q79DRAFT_424683 [Trametes meyenii]